MRNITATDHEILLSRHGELVRISACGKNAIRFQGLPGGTVIRENYNLMPQPQPAVTEHDGQSGSLTCGKLKCVIGPNGKVSFYFDGKKILEEKPEITFEDGFRHYTNKGSGLWSARVTF